MKKKPEFDLKPLIYPKSIVVIGLSSRNSDHPGNTTFIKNMMEMDVKTYGVAHSISSLANFKIYNKISDLPEVPDLAVFALAARFLKKSFMEAIEFGIKGGIIIGGGFSETGESGKKLQEEIVEIGIIHNFPFIGPNCIGIYSPPLFDTIFLPSERLVRPKKGNIAILSQSGGILLDQFMLSFTEREMGMSTGVSIGNKALVDETDLLNFFNEDENTNVVGLYIEGFADNAGRRFAKKTLESNKDVVVLFGGRSEAGSRAAASHTASLAGSSKVVEAAFKQYGVIQAFNETELKNYLKILSMISNPYSNISCKNLTGQNIAILTLSGGHGVLASDFFEEYGLGLAQFSEAQKDHMEMLVSPTAARIAGFDNPVDLTGAATEEDVASVLEYLLVQKNVDMIISLILPYPPQISMSLGRRIVDIANTHSKPVINFVPWDEKYNLIREALEINNFPCTHTIEEAVIMAKALQLKSRADQIKANKK